MPLIDDNNFFFTLRNKTSVFGIQMKDGKLEINSVEYQEDAEDPTYALVREIARLWEMRS